MKRRLHRSVTALTRKMYGYTGAIQSSRFGQENIHRLRTGFKKLRALLRWQQAGKEYFTGTRTIYLIAGELRNIQVLQQLLQDEHDLQQPFQNWLAVAAGKVKKQWHAKRIMESAGAFYRKVSQLNFRGIKNKRFFSKRFDKIRGILSVDPVTDTLVHDIRKMLKDMLYVLLWWNKKMGNPLQLCKTLRIEQLENLCKVIGDYNDKRMLLIMLATFASQQRDPMLIEENNALIDKWDHRKRHEKEKMIAMLRYEFGCK